MVLGQDGAAVPEPADDTITAMTLDDQDILLSINAANTGFPSVACYSASVVSPNMGFVALRDSAYTVSRTNLNIGALNFQGGVRCA